ncbi:hypothetical protein G4Y79_06960 [Phototrophicus methaneseepsis]|uniref:Uncharacterized protein n=1 Tax=Phototrophicus methaneseepsis TaxID=2710758 RepID=A0A7S8EBX5_9CHLR|nr:hypothetical protein [Phototrophicus methaneseepsis]QPC84107.1 hypothetical protein G4Y79_06960 [Phototrophicus methaneseepsis]
MQAPKRLSVKLFAENPEVAPVADLVPVFQHWIQLKAVAGLLIDVADYKHVHHGPGVILIGHEADYAYDLSTGRPGIQYTIKRTQLPSLTDAINLALTRALDAARILQTEEGLNGLRIGADEIEITIADRLGFPNEPDVVAQVIDVIKVIAVQAYGDAASIAVADGDERDPIRVTLKSEGPTLLETVQDNIPATVS